MYYIDNLKYAILDENISLPSDNEGIARFKNLRIIGGTSK